MLSDPVGDRVYAMNDRSDHSTILPPDTLKTKSDRPGGTTRDAAIGAAQDVLRDNLGAYRDASRDAVARLCQAASERDVETGAFLSHCLKAHSLLAQGGVFGYPLLGLLGDSLCRYVEFAHGGGELDPALVARHTDALRTIVSRDVTGWGEPDEQALVDDLRAEVGRVTGSA